MLISKASCGAAQHEALLHGIPLTTNFLYFPALWKLNSWGIFIA